MKISFVIATHQRASYLKQCLHSILEQSYPETEIIVAHTGAPDGTFEVCENFHSAYPKIDLRYIVCTEKGSAAQRNEGFDQSSGDWVMFADDDIILRQGFISEVLNTINHFPDIAAVSGRIENQFFEPLGTYTKFLLYMSGVSSSGKIAGKVVGPVLNFLPEEKGEHFEFVDWVPIGVSLINRSAYIEAGGFPSHFKGYSFAEDVCLSLLLRRKYQLVLNRKAVAFHYDLGSAGHKDYYRLAKMQMCNRVFILKNVLNTYNIKMLFSLYVWHAGKTLPLIIRKPVQGFKMLAGFTIEFFANI
ncbi:MAG: glycosyltransferase family 2 protein [Cytophagaceae bacterium]